MTTTPLSSNDEVLLRVELKQKALEFFLDVMLPNTKNLKATKTYIASVIAESAKEDRKAREAEIERLARIDEARLFHKKIVEKPYHHLDAACQGFMENNRLFAVYRIAELQPQGDKTE